MGSKMVKTIGRRIVLFLLALCFCICGTYPNKPFIDNPYEGPEVIDILPGPSYQVPRYSMLHTSYPNSDWIIASKTDSIDYDSDGVMDDLFFGPCLLNTKTLEGEALLSIYGYRSPEFSPDGKKIVTERGGHIYTVSVNQIYPFEIDTLSFRKLTNTGRNFNPKWNRDGKWIIYESDVDEFIGFGIW